MKYFFRSLLPAALLLWQLAPLAARAQSVGIGTVTPDASAALDIRAADKGLLIPRLTAGQRTGIATPPQGLLVYQTDGSAGGGAGTGFWYYAGTPAAWTYLNPAGGADNLGNHTATTALNLGGNALTGSGASLGAAVGVGVRADGGLNIGQNTFANNVYLGYQAGQANVFGSLNQFVGYQSGAANTSGNYNLFSGPQSGLANTTGNYNLFEGAYSGQANTTGGGNLFSGPYSGYLNTTGSFNLFSGFESGFSNTTGGFNLFSGYRAGYRNTTASNNVFLGYTSGFGNTTGTENVFVGTQSGLSNTTGGANVYLGYQSGFNNTTGSRNQFNGYQSGYFNTTGTGNVFSGYQTGYRNTTGSDNVFSGYQSGQANTTGYSNVFQGYRSGYSTTIGEYNTFNGYSSGHNNTTGGSNTFLGGLSGSRNTTGNSNLFLGLGSGGDNTTGSENVFSGTGSGFNSTTGNQNVFSGYRSGQFNTTGSTNTALGYDSGPANGSGAITNATAIGAYVYLTQSNTVVLGNGARVGIGTSAPAARLHVYSADNPAALRLQSSASFGAAALDFYSDPQGSANEWRPAFLLSTDAGGFTGGLAFYTNGSGAANRTGAVEGMRLVNGRLGIGTATPSFTLDVNGSIRCVGPVNTTSDQRLKQNIRPLDGALAGVLALRGVRYTFRQAVFKDLQLPAGEQVGLLAQEVARVYPELVSTDQQGYKAVNYAQLAPVLIEAIKELKADNDTLRQQLRQFQQQQQHDRAAAEAQATGFAQRLRALEAGGVRADAGR